MPIFKAKNENFFKKWSPEMAYVLGFFAADGNMNKHKNGGFYLEFTSADIEILQKIKKAMNLDNKISTRIRDGRVHYRIQFSNKEMFFDLINFGITPKKSKTIKFPNIPQDYLSHFLRGYFDGDGHVSQYGRKDRSSKTILTGFTSGSEPFIKQLFKILRNEKIISKGTCYFSGRGYRLCFSVRDSLKLYNYMYNNTPSLFLSRKKVIFENYFNNLLGT